MAASGTGRLVFIDDGDRRMNSDELYSSQIQPNAAEQISHTV